MTACAVVTKDCVSFSNKLEDTIKKLKVAGTLSILHVRAIIITVVMSISGIFLLRNVRRTFEKCDNSCPTVDCVDIDKVTSVRDRLITLSDAITQLVVVDFFTGKLVRRILTDWDDLVEDMTVATDSEFRDLISKVAKEIA